MLTFDLFRFQLLPLSQQQQELFARKIPISAEEIRELKNVFFDDVLGHLPEFRHRGLLIRHKVEYHQNRLIVFKLGTHKSIDRHTEEFRKERIESWPNVTVIIDNAPERQVIAISRNQLAFASSRAVAKLIEKTFAHSLRQSGLSLHISEQFEQHSFWSVIADYSAKVSRVRFEMISPNMANISRVLKVDLKRLNRESNSQKTTIALEAVQGAALELDPKDDLISGCVEYASLGGGDIAIKIRGIKKEIRTSTTVKSVQIDEMVLQALPGSDLLGALQQLLTK